MKSKNKNVIMGMRFLAVFAILSMTVFSYSYNIAYATELDSMHVDTENTENSSNEDQHSDENHSEENESEKSKDSKDGSSHNDDESGGEEVGDREDKTRGKGHGKEDRGSSHEKMTICHATHSETNPYVEITISVNGEDAHKHHQDKEDIIPAPEGGCPKGEKKNNDNHGDSHRFNNPPVINLTGNDTISINQGVTFVDPGVQAYDIEDGEITLNVVKAGVVDVNTLGTYTITYSVKDSKGLSATTVNRTVNVIPKKAGKITFCLVLSDDQKNVATSTYKLPQGEFTISLATTTSNIASTTIKTQTWSSSTFSPDVKKFTNVDDVDCVTYDNLDYGDYLYSTLSINGNVWNQAVYNDQDNVQVTGLHNFFKYGNTNTNSDGVIVIGQERPERVLFVYSTYKPALICLLPEIITSSLEGKVNQNFTHTLNASSTSSVNWEVSTSTLPVGLSFATSTNTISGVPTTAGEFNVAIKATNSCGFNEKMLGVKILPADNGGGTTRIANLSISKTASISSINVGDEIVYTITVSNAGPDKATNVRVSDVLASTTIDFVSATSTVGQYATSTGLWLVGDLSNGSSTALTITVKTKANTEGQKISNTASVTSDLQDNDTANNSSTVDVSVNRPNTGGGGGGTVIGGGSGNPYANGPIAGSFGGGSLASSPIVTSVSSSTVALPAVQGCNYLLDYLRSDFDNSSMEVIKLQAFLKNFEGFSNLELTGVYDQATINAVNVFQMRYKADILTPWGHTAPTGYVYILTKKKINEIYCRMAFPVNASQQSEIDGYRNSNKGGVNVSSNEVGYGVGGDNNTYEDIAYESDDNGIFEKRDYATTVVSIASSAKNRVDNLANVGLTTLAGFSSSIKGIASDFISSIIGLFTKLWNLLASAFSLSTIPETSNICENNAGIFSGLNSFLALVIAVMGYLWYRDRKNHKRIEEINKEIDLK